MSQGRTDSGRRTLRRAGRWILRRVELVVPGIDDIRRHRPLGTPLVVVPVLSLASAYALRPMVAEAMAGDTARGVEAWLWLSAFLSPVSAGAKALALGALAWSVLVVAGRDAPFRLLVSIFLYGEALLALHPVAIAAVLQMRGPGAVAGPEDLYVAMGLDALVQPVAPALAAAVRALSVAHAVWFLFVSCALVRVPELSGRWAVGLATGAWMLTLGVAAVRAVSFG